MITEERLINALGEEAYQIGLQLVKENAICSYNEDYTVREKMLGKGDCMHCFVRQCPMNK